MTARITRRAMLLAGGALVAAPRRSEGSTYSMMRELRRMVGFAIADTDTLAESNEENGTRWFKLTRHGWFRESAGSIALAPLGGLTDVVIFVKGSGSTREIRLLIDGEFYSVRGR